MKRRWTLVLLLGVAAAIAAGAFYLFAPADPASQKELSATREKLRAEGYKIDLAEFDFSTSAECQAREAVLNQAFSASSPYDRATSDLRGMELMPMVSDNTAVVLSKSDSLPTESGEDLWPMLRKLMESNRAEYDDAAQTVLSGPIAFNLKASRGHGLLLPHLAKLKSATHIFGQRAILDLHEGRGESAYTNMLAATRITTAWHPEPIKTSHLVRVACLDLAYGAVWQFLHAGGGTEPELANLQAEWESLELCQGLPETAAFARSSITASCQSERNQPLIFDLPLKEAIESPRFIWPAINDYFNRRRYLQAGTYEDEKAFLLYHRDRELELKNALQKSTWSEMRSLPAAGPIPAFESKHNSIARVLMGLQERTLTFGNNQGGGWLKRVAEAEAKRRLLVTALALEHFHLQHHAYPETLQALVPDYLKAIPIDFMDGKPLRYHPAAKGQFTLYSVGADCIDNGGKAPARNKRNTEMPGREQSLPETDLIWPLPASAQDIATAESARIEAERAAYIASCERSAETEWILSAKRPALVEQILRTPAESVPEPRINGRALTELIRADHSATNRTTIGELLTLKQITNSEPTLLTFELPIDYHAATNLGEISLSFDPSEQPRAAFAVALGLSECKPAANGKCLLEWDSIFEPPGKHVLQAVFAERQTTGSEPIEVKGPLLTVFSTNICHFSHSSAQYEPKFGAPTYGKLPELNGIYSAEFTTPTGAHLHTMSGQTTNGVIKLFWNLTDDHGHTLTGETFNSVFTITLPASGRTQVQRGP